MYIAFHPNDMMERLVVFISASINHLNQAVTNLSLRHCSRLAKCCKIMIIFLSASLNI